MRHDVARLGERQGEANFLARRIDARTLEVDGMNERRQHSRLSIAVEVDFGSEHNFYSARTRDISVGGLIGLRFVNLSHSAKKSIEVFMALREPMAFRMLESDDESE